jgi:tight adherence protein C
LSLRAGQDLVVRYGPGPVADEVQDVLRRHRHGVSLADALVELDDRTGGATAALVRAVRDGDRYGIPLTTTMRELVDEARRERRQRAAERIRQLPVRMLFPLVLCVLPAFGLLTVAPVVLDALRSVR